MRRPPRSDEGPSADRSPNPPADEGQIRGILGLLRLLASVTLLCALAVGAALYGPAVVDELDAYVNPVDVEQPPPAGERTADDLDEDDPGASTYEGRHTTFTSDDVEDFVHHEVNDRRAERGLDPLEWDATVASVSRAHSADMHERDYFAHQNPDGEQPFDRFQSVSNYCRGYGENLAATVADQRVQEPESGDVVRYRTPQELADGLVEQWMNSPPHRDAILEESWDRGGVGVYLADDGQVYATHNFCAAF